MRLTGIQSAYTMPRFGQTLPKVANRFEIDLSEASAEHKPLILTAIKEFNQSGMVKKNRLKDVPDNTKFHFVSDENGNVLVHDTGEIAGFIIPKSEDITQDNLYLAIESVAQGLNMEY